MKALHCLEAELSNAERKLNVVQVVQTVENDFRKLAEVHGAVEWQREASFATQILNGNSYLMGVAMADQDSLKQAVINVAAIGLSLNPFAKLAYLVPRGKKVCLDISYQGYVQLAIEVGAIKWAKAEMVYEKDVFEVAGLNKEPIHRFQPFGDRGEPVGVYSLAKTHDGEFLFDFMTAAQVVSIRDRSESYKAWKAGTAPSTPWESDFEEMVKKTMLRRAYKSWPKADSRQQNRFAQAVDVTNDIDFNAPPVAAIAAPASHHDESLAEIRELLEKLTRTEKAYLAHATRLFRREIKALSDLTPQETNTAIVQLRDLASKLPKKEEAHENAE